jgi:pimeloyl-ACP methyl ester carboxylesterase
MTAAAAAAALRRAWSPSPPGAALAAEARLLAHVAAPRRTFDVPIRTSGAAVMSIHTTHVPAAAGATPSCPPLVLVHGYGFGGALWYRNVDGLRDAPHRDVWLIDVLGNALSSRPRATAATAEDAEEACVAALEAWRAAVGLERMTLLGHSLGGYTAACYALRYPTRVSSLVLASPLGLPASPPPASVGGDPFANLGTLGRGAARAWAAAWGAGLTPHRVIRCVHA